MATSTFGMYVSWKEFVLITKIAAIMYGMYVINGIHRPEPRSSGGNTSSNPQIYIVYMKTYKMLILHKMA